jgi:hypothetical protein
LQSIIVAIPHQVPEAVQNCLSRLSRPPIAGGAYLNIMRRIGLVETAAFLESNLADWQP